MKRKSLGEIKRIINQLCERNEIDWSEHPNMDAVSAGQCEGSIAAYKICLALLEGTPLSDLIVTAEGNFSA